MKTNRDNDNTIFKYPLVFNDVIQINEDQWFTKLTNEQITDLYESGVIIYNPKIQRKLKIKNKGTKL